MQDGSLILLKIIPSLVAGGLLASLFVRGAAVPAASSIGRVRGLNRILAAAVLFSVAAIPYPKNNVHLSDQSFPTPDGNLIRLSTLIGKPTVVNLWAAWCGPCRREMPIFRDAQLIYPNLTFVFANQGETSTTVQEYLASARADLDNVLLDTGRDIAGLAGGSAVPTTLFFDRQGTLKTMHQGALSADTLAKTLDALVPK